MTSALRTSPALFLDRDGVINVDTHYVHREENFIFQDGIFELVKQANAKKYEVIIVTNQSGIGRGFFSQKQFISLTSWMVNVFADHGARITKVYHCPYHPKAKIIKFQKDHPWRKPKPGMVRAAAKDLNIDLKQSLMIGDRWSDVQCASAAGVAHIALVGTRHTQERAPSENLPAVTKLRTIKQGVKWFDENTKYASATTQKNVI